MVRDLDMKSGYSRSLHSIYSDWLHDDLRPRFNRNLEDKTLEKPRVLRLTDPIVYGVLQMSTAHSLDGLRRRLRTLKKCRHVTTETVEVNKPFVSYI